MPSRPSAPNTLNSGRFPKLLKQPLAMLACSVAEIDSVPVPAPTNEQQIESMVARLGDLGIAAAAEALGGQLDVTHADTMAAAGN